MDKENSSPHSHGHRMTLICGLLAVFAVIAYVAYSGTSSSKDVVIKGALIQLRKAQIEFHRTDHDGDGYLEYTFRLKDLCNESLGESIAPALAAACDDDATDALYGYRFRALRGLMIERVSTSYSTAPDGNGTLDGFSIAAIPISTKVDSVYYIAETGEPWQGATPSAPPEFLPERR